MHSFMILDSGDVAAKNSEDLDPVD